MELSLQQRYERSMLHVPCIKDAPLSLRERLGAPLSLGAYYVWQLRRCLTMMRTTFRPTRGSDCLSYAMS